MVCLSKCLSVIKKCIVSKQLCVKHEEKCGHFTNVIIKNVIIKTIITLINKIIFDKFLLGRVGIYRSILPQYIYYHITTVYTGKIKKKKKLNYTDCFFFFPNVLDYFSNSETQVPETSKVSVYIGEPGFLNFFRSPWEKGRLETLSSLWLFPHNYFHKIWPSACHILRKQLPTFKLLGLKIPFSSSLNKSLLSRIRGPLQHHVAQRTNTFYIHCTDLVSCFWLKMLLFKLILLKLLHS